MDNFVTLMRRAEALKLLEPDPNQIDWYVGYMRGLRRLHHGESFGSLDEHKNYMQMGIIDEFGTSKSAVMQHARRFFGEGYRAGYAGREISLEESTTK